MSLDQVGKEPVWAVERVKRNPAVRVVRLRPLVPGARLHDLRHFAATEALKAGVPDLNVSRMVGHSRTSTTKDLYGHVIPEDMSAAATAIGDALGAWDR